MPIGTGGALLAGGALQGIGSLFGAGKGASAATKAAQLQASAAVQAQQLQAQMFQILQGNLQPFLKAGQAGIGEALFGLGLSHPHFKGSGYLLPDLAKIQAGFPLTQAQLAQTPGYQFTLAQGEQAVQNALAAQGLGVSGPEAKSAANYAAGLASTTYQNQFQNWLQSAQLGLSAQQQNYNMLGGVGALGESAGAGVGTLGTSAIQGITNALTSGAAATAGGVIGSANALIGGAQGVGNAASNTALLLALNNSGMFGSGTPVSGGGVFVNPSGQLQLS